MELIINKYRIAFLLKTTITKLIQQIILIPTISLFNTEELFEISFCFLCFYFEIHYTKKEK